MDINYSIIIPHYNIPDLLMRCLRSIPVREDVQVIVVDDCSPDADTYLDRYPELSRPYLEYYSTEKGGSAGRARNVGLEHAKGKWLIFADADDFFDEGIDQIFDDSSYRKEDMLLFNCRAVMSDNLSVLSKRDLYWQNTLLKHYQAGQIDHVKYQHFIVWGRMFRRDLVEINTLRFDETSHSNDCMFAVRFGGVCKSIAYIDKCIYVVTERMNSLSSVQSFSSESLETRIGVAINVAMYWRSVGFEGEFIPYLYWLKKLYFVNKRNFIRQVRRISETGIIGKKELIRKLFISYGIKQKIVLFFLGLLTLGYRIEI